MKVFILLSRLHHGGAEVRTLQMIEQLKGKCEFIVYLTSGEAGILENDYKKYSTVVLKDLNKTILNDFIGNLKKYNPDTIHINANLASGVYCLISRVLGYRNCYSQIRTSSDYSSSLSYKIKKPIFRAFTNIFSKKVIGVCDSANNLTRTPVDKWVTIYNGFNQPEMLMKESSNEFIKIIMVSRLHPVKNHEFAFKVVSELNKRTKARLYIYGEGDFSYKKKLLEAIDKYNIEDFVEFCGETKTPQVTISKYDILLLTSIREGLPGVVIEAMSVGVPSICSNLDGCLEIKNYSSSVNCLPVGDEHLNLWCDYILYSISTFKRHDIIDDFELSPFNLDNHCKKIYHVWNSL